jgi:hypothetical protein
MRLAQKAADYILPTFVTTLFVFVVASSRNFVELISLCSFGIYVSLFEAGCMPSLQLQYSEVYSKYYLCRWMALSSTKATDMGR